MTHGRAVCRILYVIDDMGVGGAQKQIAETANRLNSDEFPCDVVCISSGGPTLADLPSACKTYVLGAGKVYDPIGAGAALRLASIVRSGRYSIVEAYLPMAHLLGAVAVLGLRRTALVAARRQVAGLDPRWMDAVGGLLNRVTRLSIANSHTVKRSIIERYRLPARRIVVIPNFIEAAPRPLDRIEARKRLGVPPGDFVWAAAGSFLPVKDYPTIVRAFAAFWKKRRAGTLLLAGGGAQRKAVAGLALRLGLNGEARFLGSVRDVHAVLAAADVFVHASASEGMSNAILEAMAAGLPVVASDIPANREVMGQACGAFFAPGDWQGCLKGIEYFADDTAAARAAGLAARERIRRAYDCDLAIRRRQRIYRSLAGVVNGNYEQRR